jgi:hypothetical protein
VLFRSALSAQFCLAGLRAAYRGEAGQRMAGLAVSGKALFGAVQLSEFWQRMAGDAWPGEAGAAASGGAWLSLAWQRTAGRVRYFQS